MPKFDDTNTTIDTSDGSGNPCGPYSAKLFSNAGGLDQFGAFEETLPPGSSSSVKHYHMVEDEMAYVVAGEVTVEEGDVTYTLRAGEAATFKAGVAKGHRLVNTSDKPATYLMIGTRAPKEHAVYPDNDCQVIIERDPQSGKVSNRVYTTLDGQPATSPYILDEI